MTATATLNLPALPVIHDSVAAYISAVNALPLLSEADERALAARLHEDGDTDAARQLVLANLRLVVAVSRNYSGYGLNQGDLIQEGNIGLLKAVRKFDPARGVRLATFAMYWIKAEMHEFIIRNWRIVKIATTKAQRKLFFNKNRLMRRSDGNAESNEHIAQSLNVKPEEVEEMRGRLHNTETVALSGDDDDSPGAEVFLADDSPAADAEEALEARDRLQALQEALETLNERERAILTARRLNEPPLTLQQLADVHGVSVERVRQIENAAMKKVAARVRDNLALPAA